MANQKMLKIKLKQSICGTRTGDNGEDRGTFVYDVGRVLDWPAHEAERFVDRGIAELVEVGK